jgi:protocatechuate 3,4-dioxygenase beta subunit
MNEDIQISRQLVSRRRALGLGGTIGLGGLLAACGGTSTTATNDRAGSASETTASASGTTASASGTAGTGQLQATTTPASGVRALLDKAGTCSMAKEETAGPYWFDVDSIRTDIRESRPGTPLYLALRVQDTSSCSSGGTATPVANSVVEIWHCDAGGSYSGFESASAGGGGGGGGQPGSGGSTSEGSYSAGEQEAATGDDGTYLRGAQVADAEGIVQFTTIYPGWYPGRTVHIHLKVHIDKLTVLTTQLYMDESVNSEAFAKSPYNERTGRDTFNDGDNIYDASGLLAMTKKGSGYQGVINLGIDV